MYMNISINKDMLYLSYDGEYRIDDIASLPHHPVIPTFSYQKDLQKHLQGRKLLLDEIPFPIDLIQTHYEYGYVQYHHGVIKRKGTYICQRCGNQNKALFCQYNCARCQRVCAYCRSCIMMGRFS